MCFKMKQGKALVHLEVISTPNIAFTKYNLCLILAALVLHSIQSYKLHMFSTRIHCASKTM